MSKELALSCIEKGFAVIPVGKNRRPLTKNWTTKFALTAHDVNKLFDSRPGAQVGIVTGRPSGIVVIDLDNKGGQVAAANLQLLMDEGWPKTMAVRTQTGGLHLYYQAPSLPIKSVSAWRPGIDIRAEGGQVVAPGSKGESGDYELLTNGVDPQKLPPELADDLPQKSTPRTAQTQNTSTQKVEGLIVTGLPFVPPSVVRAGERDSTIFKYAASLQARDVPKEEAVKQISAYYEKSVKDKGGFSLEDALAKVEQVYGRYAKSAREIDEDQAQEVPDPEQAALLTQKTFEAIERYIFVVPDGAYYDQWTGGWVKPQALAEAMRRVKAWMGDTKPKGEKIMRNLWDQFKTNRAVRCVDGVVYQPGGDLITLKKHSKRLNMWTKPEIDAKPGDTSLFINHLREMVDGDEVSLTFILDWMAHLVQFPGDKVGSTVLLSSTEEGLGKSLIGKVLQTILGQKNVAYIGATHLQSSFNEWLEHSSLAIVEEFSMLGKWSLANKMKDLVTNDTVRINAKFRSEYTAKNHTNFLFFSNYPDAAALGSIQERRTFIHHTDLTKDELAAKYHKTKEEYYGDLWDWARGDGPSFLAHALLHRDIQQFRAWGRFEPPATASKRFAVAANMSQFEEWLEDTFEAREGPFAAEITSKQLIQMIFETQGGRWTDRSDHELKRFIRIRTVPVGTVSMDKKTLRVQAIENHVFWRDGGHYERCEEYRRAINEAVGR